MGCSRQSSLLCNCNGLVILGISEKYANSYYNHTYHYAVYSDTPPLSLSLSLSLSMMKMKPSISRSLRFSKSLIRKVKHCFTGYNRGDAVTAVKNCNTNSDTSAEKRNKQITEAIQYCKSCASIKPVPELLQPATGALITNYTSDVSLFNIKGAGLANLGNTCFLNAILQCFTHIVPLVQGLRSYNHPRPCDRDNEGFCVICTLRDHIEYSIASMDRVVSPWKLVDNLNYISSNFRRFQQEDAHEFLQCLLDRLDSCCIYSQTKDTSLPSADESLVKQVFGGRLISKLQCCNCGHSSDTYEPLIDLSLEIENVGTLPSALESFTKVEKIEDPETKFTCEQCKEKVSVEKQLILNQAPSVAAFHLKRFKNDGSYVEKIDKHVEFPLELDLLPYTGGDQNNDVELKYNLYAVVVHIGFSSTSGHYYCFIRSAPDAWYRLDDSKVTRVQEDFVLSQEAYILFYAKEGTPWFSSFMETEKSSIDPNLFSNSPQSVLDNVDRIGTSSPNVADNCSGEVNEAGEVAVGISVDSFNKRTHNSVEVDEAKDDSHRLFTPVPLVMSNSSSEMASKVERKFSPSALRDNNSNREFNKVAKNVNIIPSTPPRSPSPDIYAEEPPTVTYSIPRNHLISEKQVPCKRQLDKDLEDSERKQAHKLLKVMPNDRSAKLLDNGLEDSERKQARKLLKGMPNDRSAKLLAAMNGSHSEGRRTRRIESSSNRNERPSSARHDPNLSSFTRLLNLVCLIWFTVISCEKLMRIYLVCLIWPNIDVLLRLT